MKFQDIEYSPRDRMCDILLHYSTSLCCYGKLVRTDQFIYPVYSRVSFSGGGGGGNTVREKSYTFHTFSKNWTGSK